MKLERSKRKILKYIFIILLIASGAAAVISGYNIIKYQIDKDKTNRNLNLIENSVVVNEDAEPEDKYAVDFKALKEQNEDVVAYLKVFGTNIDCPIVKSYNNSYYLKHSFDKQYNILGWPFADFRNSFNGNDKNIIMYGHNLNDGTLFGSLINVLSADWQNKVENRVIILVTPEETKLYEVFSTYEYKPEDYYLTTQFDSTEAYTDFLNEIRARSNRNYGIEVGQDDHILTLSSCVGTGEARVVLHAKEINNSQP